MTSPGGRVGWGGRGEEGGGEERYHSSSKDKDLGITSSLNARRLLPFIRLARRLSRVSRRLFSLNSDGPGPASPESIHAENERVQATGARAIVRNGGGRAQFSYDARHGGDYVRVVSGILFIPSLLQQRHFVPSTPTFLSIASTSISLSPPGRQFGPPSV